MTLLAQPSSPDIIPLNTSATVGPWTITVTEAISGDQAWSMLQDKNSANVPVEELPGADPETGYVLARISVQNTSAAPRVINLADFAATGSDGILRRPPSIEVPDPALQQIVPSGESVEGIVPFLVNDSETATIWFDSVLLGGNWSRAVFAFGSAAAIPTFDMADTESTDAGNSIETAVEIGETVRTGGWEITVTNWIREGEVFDAADYRTRALGSEFSPGFRAVKATITNLNPVPSVFPNDAFLVTDGDGEPWDNVLALTAPEPDASREYLPGATREGWAAFDCGAYPEFPEIVYVRAQINSIVGEPRYIVVGTVGDSSESNMDEPEDTAGSGLDLEPLDVAIGDIVVNPNDIVNLRPEPSTSGDTIVELEPGTELTITGEPVEAEGYRWYPVTVIDGGQSGYVVQDYIEAQ